MDSCETNGFQAQDRYQWQALLNTIMSLQVQ